MVSFLDHGVYNVKIKTDAPLTFLANVIYPMS